MTITKQGFEYAQAVPAKVSCHDCDRIDALARALGALDILDRDRRVFGASEHRYLRTPCHESDLAETEQSLSLSLPESYRKWLSRVGWGAGPHYGIFSRSEINAAYEEFSDIEREACGQAEAGGAAGKALQSVSDLTALEIARYCDNVRRNGSPLGAAILVRSFEGCLPISYQGCSGYSCLVVTGPFRGKVIGQSVDLIPIDQPGVSGAIWPEGVNVWDSSGRTWLRAEENRFFGFLDWIEDWIKSSTRTLIA